VVTEVSEEQPAETSVAVSPPAETTPAAVEQPTPTDNVDLAPVSGETTDPPAFSPAPTTAEVQPSLSPENESDDTIGTTETTAAEDPVVTEETTSAEETTTSAEEPAATEETTSAESTSAAVLTGIVAAPIVDGDASTEDSPSVTQPEQRPEATSSTDEEDQDTQEDANDSDVEDVTPTGVVTTTLADGVVTVIVPIETGGGSGDASPGSAGTIPPTDADGAGPASNSGSSRSAPTGVIIGSVVGSIAGLAVVAVIVWLLLRRRASRKERYVIRSPVFSPQDMGTGTGRGIAGPREKVWEFDTGSVGPTPRAERFAAAFNHNFNKIGTIFRGPSDGGSNVRGSRVDMAGGSNSLFMAGAAGRSRNNSALSPPPPPPAVPVGISARDRLSNWWSRLTEDAQFNWGLRQEQVEEPSQQPIRDMETRRGAPITSLPLHGGRRASEASVDEFNQSLTMMWESANRNDPFSDTNAVALPRPPTASANPFHDSNAFPEPLGMVPPSRYDPAIAAAAASRRRSNSSVSSLRGPNIARLGRTDSASARFKAQRAKVQSDQFDLEIAAASTLPAQSLPQQQQQQQPQPPVTTPEAIARLSFGTRRPTSYSSQISDGVSSLSDYGDPGPDVGPKSNRTSPTVQQQRISGVNGGRGRDVGQAM
jgi:hypothetical protein